MNNLINSIKQCCGNKHFSQFVGKVYSSTYKEKQAKNGLSSTLHLEVIGTGAKGSPASVALKINDKPRFIFNCGEGVQRLCTMNPASILDIRHIFVTRLSWDCIGGISGLALTASTTGGKELTLHGPPKLTDFMESSKLEINYKELNFKVLTSDKNDAYTNDTFKIDYVPIYRRKSMTDDPTIVFAGRIKPVKGSFSVKKCFDLNITSPKLKDERSADVFDCDKPQRIFLVVDIPSVDYLDSLNSNEVLKKFQGNVNSENSADVILHYSSADAMNNIKYKQFIGKFPDSTTHLILNETNRTSGFSAIYETQCKHHEINSKIFPLLRGPTAMKTESTNQCTKTGDQSCLYGGILNALPMMRLYFRPNYEIEDGTRFQKTKTECLDELKKIEGFERSLKNLKFYEEKYYTKLQLPNRSNDFPKIVFLGTGSARPSSHRNVSGILVHTGRKSSILLDCGEGTCNQIQNFYGSESDDIFANIKAVFISHLHNDHYLGLFELFDIRRKLRLDEKGPLYLFVDAEFLSYLKGMENCSKLLISDNLLIPNQRLLTCPLQGRIASELNLKSLQTCYVIHTETSFAIRLDINQYVNGKCTPFSLSYSGDTKTSKNFKKLGMNSTLLIHEASFDDSLTRAAEESRHCTMSQAIKQCSEMKPAYAILTHFSQRYTIPLINQSLPKNFGIAFDNMELVESDLPMLNPIFYTLKVMYSKEFDRLQYKASARNDKNDFVEKPEKQESRSR